MGAYFHALDCLYCNSNALSPDCMLPNCPRPIDDAELFSLHAVVHFQSKARRQWVGDAQFVRQGQVIGPSLVSEPVA